MIEKEIGNADTDSLVKRLESHRNDILQGSRDLDSLRLQVACCVVLDLVSQGWELKICKDIVQICYPLPFDERVGETRERIRRAHLLERNSQLRESAVSEFIAGMERLRLADKGWHSIFSLMRDGRELSEKLADVAHITDEQSRADALSTIISPYLQFIDGEEKCEHTGLMLRDIWRYFRHTWVNVYKSVPGRSMMILVRDAAAPNHPVIGIAALGSSVVQQTIRDRWIGWQSDVFIEDVAKAPSTAKARWLLDTLDRLIDSAFLDDLTQEGLFEPSFIHNPSQDVIDKLRRESERAIMQHRRFPHTALHKSLNGDNGNNNQWESKARTNLFRSKRCKLLANLLSIRKVFVECGMSRGAEGNLAEALKSKRFRHAAGQLVRLVKAEHVGIGMMDITVCGAIAPYNALLGGKLVCMMLCSPEVIHHYSSRYGDQVSIIASSMQGKPVLRKPRLVLLGTTSLYGSALNQYSRVNIPAENVGGRTGDKIEYRKLGLSEGFGSFHFSRETIKLIDVMLGRCKDARRVNSIFGEGVNPLMRKIREALDLLGLPSDAILRHGNRRVVYGVALARNFREVLMGLHQRPQYLIPLTKASEKTSLLADYWRKRWLLARINKPGVIDEIAQHTLSYPVRHGARVPQVVERFETSPLWEI